METSEISLHDVKVYLVLKSADRWLTNREIAKAAGVADRTARAKTIRMVRLGILDQAELYPGHRYQLSKKADKRNGGYVQRLEQAIKIFGLT